MYLIPLASSPRPANSGQLPLLRCDMPRLAAGHGELAARSRERGWGGGKGDPAIYMRGSHPVKSSNFFDPYGILSSDVLRSARCQCVAQEHGRHKLFAQSG